MGILKVLLLTAACYAGMEQQIMLAVLSYPIPKNNVQKIEHNIKKKLGKESILFLTISKTLIEKRKIEIPFKYQNTNYVLSIKETEAALFYKVGF